MATAALYSQFFKTLTQKEINLLTDAIHVTLHTSTYAPNQATHDYFDDATNEVAGTGYTAGGVAIANDVFTYTSGTRTWMYDGDDVSWASSTITARYAVLHDRTPGTNATRPLIAYQNFTTDQSTSNGTFTLQWNAAGIMTITVGAEA